MDIIKEKRIKNKNDFESIETLTDPSEIIDEINYESENFSLEAMYKYYPYSFCDGAAVIVTKDNFYASYLESDYDISKKVSHGHNHAFEKMKLLFYSLDEIIDAINDQYLLKDPDNIYIEFSTDSYSNIELPKYITPFQYDILKQINDFYLKKRNSKEKIFYEGLDGRKIEIEHNIFDSYINIDNGDSVFLSDNMDKIKERVRSKQK